MIRSLHLDSLFIPTTHPEIEYKLFQFPGGEWHIKLNTRIRYDQIDKVVISHRIKSGDDFFKLFQAKNALEQLDIKHFDLILPYFPYSRQDRVCAPGEAFGIKISAQLINSLHFDKVITLDNHSNITTALVNNCKNLSNIQYVRDVINIIKMEDSDPIFVIPDIGASTKAKQLLGELPPMISVQCDKKRNVQTGEITGFKVYADDLESKPCLIVDDICDGGGTFIGLAEQLREHNCGKLYLFTTFGIYSKGIEILTPYFDKIFCTNGFSTLESTDKLIQLKIQI